MSNSSKRKKVLVAIFNRAHYGRLQSVLKAISNHPKLALQVMIGLSASHDYFWKNLIHSRPYSFWKALPWYIKSRLLSFYKFIDRNAIYRHDFLARAIIEKDILIDSYIPLFFDGGVSETMAKSIGLGFPKIVDELKRLKPDIVFINADRFEMMALVIAAAYLNITIAHNEAGDVTGSIDESIRHAITKLSHVYFTSTEKSRKRVIQMGEDENFIFNVGSPAIDVIKNIDLRSKLKSANFDLAKSFLLVLIHPVTTETNEDNFKMVEAVASVLNDLMMPTIFLGSNIDAGSDAIAILIRKLRKNPPSYLQIVKSLPPEDFYLALGNAACAIGNSSSFIREGAFFGTPVVLIGSRQQDRERGVNVLEVKSDQNEIKNAILFQLKHGKYPSSDLFGDGKVGQKIAGILATVEPKIQKKFKERF